MTKELTSDEIVVKILEVVVDSENKRNKLFERSLKIFCTLIVAIIFAFGISLVFILNSIFA